MNSIVRNFAVPACVVALGAAAIVWNVVRMHTTERKFADELKQYQAGANRGDANAEFELSDMYFRGRGVPQDDAQAAFWSQKAADQGFAKAEDAIGYLYYYGRGLDQSYANALVWYRKAADQDFAAAQYAVAGMYYHGFGVPQSYAEALVWYKKAADQGYAEAESAIGYLYWNGLGVQRDHKEANRRYRMAANHGDKDAQRWLGLRFSPLRPWAKITNAISLIGGLFLISGLHSLRRLLRDQILRKFVLAGVLCLVTAGMNLYAHSEYCLFPSVWAATAYRLVWSFLGGIGVTLLFTAVKPRAGKVLLISSGILFATMAICLSAIAGFEMRAFSAMGWGCFVFTAFPLGMAISAVVHLRRSQNEPESGTPEPPIQNGEAPDAV
jgi:hypothetical protein